jgi:hypothetical protein
MQIVHAVIISQINDAAISVTAARKMRLVGWGFTATIAGGGEFSGNFVLDRSAIAGGSTGYPCVMSAHDEDNGGAIAGLTFERGAYAGAANLIEQVQVTKGSISKWYRPGREPAGTRFTLSSTASGGGWGWLPWMILNLHEPI